MPPPWKKASSDRSSTTVTASDVDGEDDKSLEPSEVHPNSLSLLKSYADLMREARTGGQQPYDKFAAAAASSSWSSSAEYGNDAGSEDAEEAADDGSSNGLAADDAVSTRQRHLYCLDCFVFSFLYCNAATTAVRIQCNLRRATILSVDIEESIKESIQGSLIQAGKCVYDDRTTQVIVQCV
jgi:hypothetical protein